MIMKNKKNMVVLIMSTFEIQNESEQLENYN